MATSNVTINKTAYTEIAGTGAVGSVSTPASAKVYIVLSPSLPSADTIGHLVGGGDETEFPLIGNSDDKVYAKLTSDALVDSAVIAVTVGGAVASSGGSSGAATAQFQVTTTYYRALRDFQNGGENLTDNTIIKIETYSTATGAIVSTVWENETLGFTLDTEPVVDTDVSLNYVKGTGNDAAVSYTKTFNGLNQFLTIKNNSLDAGKNLVIQATGTSSQTLQVQVSQDGTNWVQIYVTTVTTAFTTRSNTITSVGSYVADVSGFKYARIYNSAYTSGSFIVNAVLTSVNAGDRITGGYVDLIGTVNTITNNVNVVNAQLTLLNGTNTTITNSTTESILIKNCNSVLIGIGITACTGVWRITYQEQVDLTTWVNRYGWIVTSTGTLTTPLLNQTSSRTSRLNYEMLSAGSLSFRSYVSGMQTAGSFVYQLQDTTLDLTSTSSVTSVLAAPDASNVSISLKLGTAATPPQIQLFGSHTGSTTDAYAIGTPLVGVAETEKTEGYTEILPPFIFAKVTTGGATLGSGYRIVIRAKG